MEDKATRIGDITDFPNKLVENVFDAESPNKLCPASQIFELLSKKWITIILRELSQTDCMRFNEIGKQIHQISPRTLSNRLKQLEQIQLIERRRLEEKVLYSLTPKGYDLGQILAYVDSWVNKWDGRKNKEKLMI